MHEMYCIVLYVLIACMHVCMHACIYACMYACIHIHIHVCTMCNTGEGVFAWKTAGHSFKGHFRLGCPVSGVDSFGFIFFFLDL